LSTAPAADKEKPTVLPRWVFDFSISNCLTTARD
jgi:hypothetical protein